MMFNTVRTIATIGAVMMVVLTLVSCTPSARKQASLATSAQSAQMDSPSSVQMESLKSTSADRQSVEVTVYNNDLGLVKEQRNVSIDAGEGVLRFVDVAARINPVTVHIKPLSDTADFVVLEQNYEYDLISHEKLMDKYIGKTIKIIVPNEYHDRRDVIEAEVLSSSAARVLWTEIDRYGQSVNVVAGADTKSVGGETYKIGDEIYLGHPGIKVLPELPNNLISRPTLSWVYRSGAAREYPLEVSYLTGGMGWNADYILAVEAGESAKSGLSGWVTVSNQSGASYEDAKLKLVAGEVNRARQEVEVYDNEIEFRMLKAEMSAAPPAFEQTELFEYYMYDLQRPTTIKDNQTKQISLMDAPGVTVAKEYVTLFSEVADRVIIDGGRDRPDQPLKQTVVTYLKFSNTKENGLGDPLPAGTIRIYAADGSGGRQFVGEDRISHTPRDEEIRLRAGEAFDIVAERVTVDYRRVSNSVNEAEYAVTVRNRKGEDVVVGVLEDIIGRWNREWKILKSSHEYKKISADAFRFDVVVGAGREVVVKYKIRIGI